MFPRLKVSREEVDAFVASASAAQVEAALANGHPGFFDLLSLISPAAVPYRDALRKRATLERRRYYGKTVSVFAPLYISNVCVNSCRYCDFNIHHRSPRKVLTMDEVIREAEAIRSTGIDSLLIVAGEHPKVMSVGWLAEVGRELKKRFSWLALEVAPQTEAAYRELFASGYEGLTCFQETYERDVYARLHPAGPKSDYDFRLGTQERAGQAGFRTLGVAFLMGLAPWRREAASLAAHAWHLMRDCYEAKVQFAFPRLRPMSGGFAPEYPVSDDDLEQVMLAFRIVFPQCCMTVSTREAAAFRDRIVLSAADNMSAGSKVTPGGYAVDARADVGQFELSDGRPPADVYAAIRANGQDVVFKTWDRRI